MIALVREDETDLETIAAAFPFMKVYKFCSISNIDQTTENFAMDFSYFVEEIMNAKICKIHCKHFPLTAIIAKFKINKTMRNPHFLS